MKTVKKALTAAPPPATTTPHFDFEREAFASGLRSVAGIDEVGRGPLAGPAGVAAVILDPNNLPLGVDDSKVLPEAKRQELCEIIFAKALSISIVFASVEGIDAMNIRGAAPSAMARAVAGLRPPSGPGADRRPRFARRAHLPGAPRSSPRQCATRSCATSIATIPITALPSTSAMRPLVTVGRWRFPALPLSPALIPVGPEEEE